jgi:hypothetical protein
LALRRQAAYHGALRNPVGWFVACAGVIAGCTQSFDNSLYFGWDDRRVLCAQVIDDENGIIDLRRLRTHMDDAVAHDEVYDLYGHIPGVSVRPQMVDHVLDDAVARKLSFVTYRDMLDLSDPRAGLALAFDDNAVDAWMTMRETLTRHGARVTFFVTRYAQMSDEYKADLKLLAADGPDIEAHGVNHLDAAKYVADHGLDAYLQDEVLPSISVLIADGYPVHAFAYPFGSHSAEIDQALLQHIDLVRTTNSPCPWRSGHVNEADRM